MGGQYWNKFVEAENDVDEKQMQIRWDGGQRMELRNRKR